jgi:hypothetical protein
MNRKLSYTRAHGMRGLPLAPRVCLDLERKGNPLNVDPDGAKHVHHPDGEGQ